MRDQGIDTPAGFFDICDGAQGPQGVQGMKGDDGAPGMKGDDGSDGNDGADGENGADGAPGGNALVLEIPGADPLCPGDANGQEFQYGTDLNRDGDLDDQVSIVDPNGEIVAFPELDGTYIVCDGAQGATGARGPTGPEGPAGDVGGEWVYQIETCEGRIASNVLCKYFPTCPVVVIGTTLVPKLAISGRCGDSGNDDDIEVQYTGPNPSRTDQWQCSVINTANRDRTVRSGAYCVLPPMN